jgi:Spy/CpxP family protein refolding chaperone
MNRKAIFIVVLGMAGVLGLGMLSSVTQAHWGRTTITDEQRQEMMESHGEGYGMGPGMMGPGMMGPGMMDPGMMAPEMMGPGMMGPGMMGHGSMGHGTMGHGMMGHGMMGPMWMLDLTTEQRARIREIRDEQRRQNWDTMGKIMDESSRLHDLYGDDQWDPKAIGAVYGKIFDLKRHMIEASIEAHNRREAVLTQEQRDQLSQWNRRMIMGGGFGRGRGGPMHRGMMHQ